VRSVAESVVLSTSLDEARTRLSSSRGLFYRVGDLLPLHVSACHAVPKCRANHIGNHRAEVSLKGEPHLDRVGSVVALLPAKLAQQFMIF